MNTEDRLRDALDSAARTVRTAPPLPSRRTAFSRPLASALAVAAALGGIAFLATELPLFPTSGPALSPPPPQKVSVYLCIETSSSDSCRGATTEGEREAVLERLQSLPRVRTVDYESSEAAYERFLRLFKDTPGFLDATKPGDIPDSFRVEAEPGSATEIEAALNDLPGIDQIVTDPLKNP